MAVRVPDITSRIQVDTTGVDKASKTVDQSTKRMSGAFRGLAATAAGVAIAGFLKDSVDEAREAGKVSRLTEAAIRSTGGAARVTADQVAELSGALSNKIGVDDEAVQSSANLLLTFTKVRNEVGAGNDVFDQTVALGQDMAAVMGGDARSSMIQLGKAMNDPIRGVTALGRAGVQFTEDQKTQIATLIETGDQLAAQKIILGELRTQFGGAAQAAADPIDRLNVTVGNLKEQMGAALLPTIDRVAGALADMNPETAASVLKYGALTVAAGGTVIAIGRVVEGVGRTAEAFKGGVKFVSAWTDKIKAARASGQSITSILARGFTPALGIAGLALAAGATALFIWQKRKEEATRVIEDYVSALEADSGAISDNVRAMAAQHLEQAGVLKAAEKMGISLPLVTDALLGNEDAQKRLNSQLEKHYDVLNKDGTITRRSGGDAVALAEAVTRESAAFADARAKGERLSGATKKLGDQQDGTAEKTRNLKEAVDALTEAQDRAEGKAFDLKDATASYEAAVDNARETLARNGNTLDLSTKKGRENYAALKDVATAANDVTEATGKQTGKQDKANAAAQRGREQLRDLADKYGVAKGKIDNFTGAVKNVPRNWGTTLKANTEAAETKLRRISGLIEYITKNGTVRVPAAVTRGPNQLDGKANGGPISANRAYLVGERGPEVVVPRTAGTVIPNHKLAGTTINQNITINAPGMNPQESAEAIFRKARAASYAIAGAS